MDLTLQDEEFDDRYFLRGRMEILNCLNGLIRDHEYVTVYFNQGGDAILTALLEATPEHLLFDPGGDDVANKRLERAQGCVVVAIHEGIRTQFSTTWTPQRYQWGDVKVFRIPLPQKVIRLQRREAYRVTLAMNKPVLARLTGTDGQLLAELPIHDLSVGGLGMNMVAGKAALTEGDRIEVSFSMQSGLSLHCHARVRHVTPMGKVAGHVNVRVGLCFLDLPQSLSASIQRYILQVEHQRAALVQKV